MQNITKLAEFSDSARIWIYAFNRVLTKDEIASVQKVLENFKQNWNSHGEPVPANTLLNMINSFYSVGN